jgi:hypothetical protein
MTDSKTDMAAAIGPALAHSASARMKTVWTITLACALGAAAILWLILRTPGEATVSAEPPAASVAPSAPEPSRARAAASAPNMTAVASATSRTSDQTPPDPSDDRAVRAAPPIPTVMPSPVPPPPASPPPAVSSPHPKKRVYDPMGI